MSVIVVIHKNYTASDFVSRAAQEGMLIRAFDEIPNIFEIIDRNIGDIDISLYPELSSVEASDKKLNGCFVQTLNLDNRWTGANWALARHINRTPPWSDYGTRLPLSTDIEVVRDGVGVDIYVVDTGIEIGHPEFNGRASIIYESEDTLGVGDNHGHGTACAGCAAGMTRGYARSALLFSVKVLDSNNTGTLSNILAGISAVISHYNGRASTERPAVMTISVVGDSNAYSSAIDNVLSIGIVVVAAAGNSSSNLDTSFSAFPAENNGVIAVASILPSDDPSSFTNYGSRIDLLAGGSFIHTSQLQTINPFGYSTFDGTSLSAPMVAGAIACVLQDYVRLRSYTDTQIVRNYMKEHATWNQYRGDVRYEPMTPAILYLHPSFDYPEIPELTYNYIRYTENGEIRVTELDEIREIENVSIIRYGEDSTIRLTEEGTRRVLEG